MEIDRGNPDSALAPTMEQTSKENESDREGVGGFF
jgi:hypothetical protein